MQRRREGASQLQDREAPDVDHQRRAAAELVCQSAEQQGANRTKGQGQKNSLSNRRDASVEVLRNRRNAENQDEEIESVHRPAQQSGDKSMALTGGQRAEM